MSLSLYGGGGAKEVLFIFYSPVLKTGFSFALFFYDPRASPLGRGEQVGFCFLRR